MSRLKKHPALLRAASSARSTRELAGGAARVRPSGSSDAPGAAWVLEASGRARRSSRAVARARSTRRRSSAARWTCRRRRRTRAEQVLRKMQSRLGDVRRILFELYTDRGRLEALRDRSRARAGGRARARRAGALVHGAARGGEAVGARGHRRRARCSRSTACRSRTARAKAARARGSTRRTTRSCCACISSCTASSRASTASRSSTITSRSTRRRICRRPRSKVLYYAHQRAALGDHRRRRRAARDLRQRVSRLGGAARRRRRRRRCKVRPLRLAYRSTAPVMRFARARARAAGADRGDRHRGARRAPR